MLNLKQAAEQVGIGEGLLILWIAVGKFKPSIELNSTSKGLTGKAKQAFDSFAGGPNEQALGWNRFSLTDKDIERLRKMVEATAEPKAKTGPAHVKGTDYSVAEVAALWNVGVDKIREVFENEPDVIKLKNPAKRGKRAYTTLRIPESVESRIRRKLSS
jgi:hypothetical protein